MSDLEGFESDSSYEYKPVPRSLRKRDKTVSYVDTPESSRDTTRPPPRTRSTLARRYDDFNFNIRVKQDMTSYDSLIAQLREVMDEIKQHEASWPFLEPVPEDVPYYYEMIQHPTDLQTIEEKLESFDYESELAFFEELYLMLENCKMFNQPKSEIAKTGKQLQKYIEELQTREFPLFEDLKNYKDYFAEGNIAPIPVPETKEAEVKPEEEVAEVKVEEKEEEEEPEGQEDDERGLVELTYPVYSDEDKQKFRKEIQSSRDIIELVFFFWILSSTTQYKNIYLTEHLNFRSLEEAFIDFEHSTPYLMLHWYIYAGSHLVRRLKNMGEEINQFEKEFGRLKLLRKMGFATPEEQQEYFDMSPAKKIKFALEGVYERAYDSSIIESNLRLISDADLRQSQPAFVDDKTASEYFCFNQFGPSNSTRVYRSENSPLVQLAYDIDYVNILSEHAEYLKLKKGKRKWQNKSLPRLKAIIRKSETVLTRISKHEEVLKEVGDRLVIGFELYYAKGEEKNEALRKRDVFKCMYNQILPSLEHVDSDSSEEDESEDSVVSEEVSIPPPPPPAVEETPESGESKDAEEEFLFDGKDYHEIRRSSRKRKTVSRFSVEGELPKKKPSLLRNTSSRPFRMSKRQSAVAKPEPQAQPVQKKAKTKSKPKPKPPPPTKQELITKLESNFAKIEKQQFQHSKLAEAMPQIELFYSGHVSDTEPLWELVAEGKAEIKQLSDDLGGVEVFDDVVSTLEEEEARVFKEEQKKLRAQEAEEAAANGVHNYRSSRLALEEEKRNLEEEEKARKRFAAQLWESFVQEQRQQWNRQRVVKVRALRMQKREQAKLLSKETAPSVCSSENSDDSEYVPRKSTTPAKYEQPRKQEPIPQQQPQPLPQSVSVLGAQSLPSPHANIYSSLAAKGIHTSPLQSNSYPISSLTAASNYATSPYQYNQMPAQTSLYQNYGYNNTTEPILPRRQPQQQQQQPYLPYDMSHKYPQQPQSQSPPMNLNMYNYNFNVTNVNMDQQERLASTLSAQAHNQTQAYGMQAPNAYGVLGQSQKQQSQPQPGLANINHYLQGQASQGQNGAANYFYQNMGNSAENQMYNQYKYNDRQ